MIKEKPSLCIYHGNCPDGFGAAYAVWKKYPHIEFIPSFHGMEKPNCAGHDIVIVDFSFKLDIMLEIIDEAKSVTILDHHKTAEAYIQPLIDEGKVQGIFDMQKSGARLSWEWFHSSDVPMLLKHIEDGDIWRFELDETREVNLALSSYEYDFNLWDSFMSDKAVANLKNDGRAFKRLHFKNINELLEITKFITTIKGYKSWCANLPPMMISDACHLLCKTPMPDGEMPDLGMAFYIMSDGSYKVSLRSEGDFDVSDIAKEYGGGGHKNAASFKVKSLTDL